MTSVIRRRGGQVDVVLAGPRTQDDAESFRAELHRIFASGQGRVRLDPDWAEPDGQARRLSALESWRLTRGRRWSRDWWGRTPDPMDHRLPVVSASNGRLPVTRYEARQPIGTCVLASRR